MEFFGGRAEIEVVYHAKLCKIEKRGVPGRHENMPSGNSFPQICVVSIHNNEGILVTRQEYLGVVAIVM
jgi:hypothetical protein